MKINLSVTDKELHTIVCALQVAAKQYEDDRRMYEEETNPGLRRIHNQFKQQRDDVNKLLNRLEP